MSEQNLPNAGQPSDDTSDEEAGRPGPGAGISATGRTSFAPGEAAGSDYGDPGGIGIGVDQEMAGDGQRGDELDGEQ